MTDVDTNEQLTIFPKPIGLKMLLGCGALAACSLAIVPFAWRDGDFSMVWLALGFGVFMVLLLGLLIRKKARGNLTPALMLSPEGLHFIGATKGAIPWGKVNGLGSYSTRHVRGLVINIDEDAFDGLEKSALFKASRKFDSAIGVHALIILENMVEISLYDLADMIHDYSVAHGGPRLQPNRDP